MSSYEFERLKNGWLVTHLSDEGQDRAFFADPNWASSNPEASCLVTAIQETFGDAYGATAHSPGFSIRHLETGWAKESKEGLA